MSSIRFIVNGWSSQHIEFPDESILWKTARSAPNEYRDLRRQSAIQLYQLQIAQRIQLERLSTWNVLWVKTDIASKKAAIRQLARATRNLTGNLPLLPAVYPDRLAPVVRTAADGVRELTMMRWGFAPVPSENYIRLY